jgi:hypothetical protein
VRALAKHGSSVDTAWVRSPAGFAIGAVIYSVSSLFLEQKGAALRDPSRFMDDGAAVAGFLFALYIALLELAPG